MVDQSKSPRRFSRVLLALIVLLILVAVFYRSTIPHSVEPIDIPRKQPDLYGKMVSAFSDAVYALQVCDRHRIPEVVPIPTKIYPDEPAGWINLAVMHIRYQRFAEAKGALQRARELSPNRSEADYVDGILEKQQYHLPQAVELFEKAVKLDGNNLRARFALAQVCKSQDTPEADAKAVEQFQAIAVARPGNVVAQLGLLQSLAKKQDRGEIEKAIIALKQFSQSWAADARTRFTALETAVQSGSATPADFIIFDNLTKGEPQVRIARRELTTLDDQAIVDPIDYFITLPSPARGPAASDDGLSFTEQPLSNTAGKASFARIVSLDPELKSEQADPLKLPAHSDDQTAVVTVDPAGLTITMGTAIQRIDATLAGPGGSVHPDEVLFADWSYHYREDLILAGPGGLKFYKLDNEHRYLDVTDKTGLPAAILSAAYSGAWPIDIEADGDLDIVLGTPAGPPTVLQNNGDGTFKPINPFSGIEGVTAFAWLDIDGDYAPDAAIVDGQGKLHVYRYILSGTYTEWQPPEGLGKVVSLTVADMNRDGVLDLVALQSDGKISRVSRKSDQTGWELEDLASWPTLPQDGSSVILTADLDNNGASDLITTGSTGTQVWLIDSSGKPKALVATVSASGAGIVGATPQGRIDLSGINADGKPIRLVNQGTRHYNAYLPKTRAIHIPEMNKQGSDRINSFGLGGFVRVRAGMISTIVPITGPQSHIGIGPNRKMDAIEYAWNDGTMQGEFEVQVPKGLGPPLPINQTIYTPKRLKGSCPWLFAWNGKQMEFVTDVLWGSPLGLKINAQDTAGVAETLDWVKVRGDKLVARDGYYDLRITAELWETHFFDMVKLMTVDHPAGTEVNLDERFSIPFPPKRLFVTTPLKPAARAVDDLGNDVTEVLSSRDGKYLDTFGLGAFQGITRDHYVELDLTPEHPDTQTPILLCYGWIHPTDSSINVAVSQGKHDPPKSLSLEVPDGKGGWRVAKSNLGFPMGKNKTIAIPLEGIFKPGEQIKVRLRTNLEIYWDFIGTASLLPNAELHTSEIAPSMADLQFRGFSTVSLAGTSSPEIPNYNDVMSTGHPWLDLEGFYTRFGDVKELLNRVDDRYVILNAGDEIRLRFPAQPPPPAGWVRDYVFISDGWEKDGNFNTGFCRTVLPLPSHSNPAYKTPPGGLEDDPVYRRFPKDWETYHTRFVSPRDVRRSPLPMDRPRS